MNKKLFYIILIILFLTVIYYLLVIVDTMVSLKYEELMKEHYMGIYRSSQVGAVLAALTFIVVVIFKKKIVK